MMDQEFIVGKPTADPTGVAGGMPICQGWGPAVKQSLKGGNRWGKR